MLLMLCIKTNATKFDLRTSSSNLFSRSMQRLRSIIDIFAFSERPYVYSSIFSLRYSISRTDLKAMNAVKNFSLCSEQFTFLIMTYSNGNYSVARYRSSLRVECFKRRNQHQSSFLTNL